MKYIKLPNGYWIDIKNIIKFEVVPFKHKYFWMLETKYPCPFGYQSTVFESKEECEKNMKLFLSEDEMVALFKGQNFIHREKK